MKHLLLSLIFYLHAGEVLADEKVMAEPFFLQIECGAGSWTQASALPVKKFGYFHGYQTEWINREFLDTACATSRGEKICVRAQIERSSVERYPEYGWGARSGRAYLKLFVKVLEKLEPSETAKTCGDSPRSAGG